MFDQTHTWRVTVAIVLVVFVVTATFGMVWHDHGHCNSAQCTLCHLVFEQPTAANSVCGVALARAESTPQSIRPASRLVARQIPSARLLHNRLFPFVLLRHVHRLCLFLRRLTAYASSALALFYIIVGCGRFDWSCERAIAVPAKPVSAAPGQYAGPEARRAVHLARRRNPVGPASQSQSAGRATTIQQSQAEEVTANLRPDPVLMGDSQFLPIFQPSQFSSDYLDNPAQFDWASVICLSAAKSGSTASRRPRT